MKGRVFVFGVGLALLPESLGANDFSIRVGVLPRGEVDMMLHIQRSNVFDLAT